VDIQFLIKRKENLKSLKKCILYSIVEAKDIYVMWKSLPEELLVGLERSQCNGKGFTDVSWQCVQILWISSAKMCLKGLGHQKYIFLKAYNIKSLLSVHVQMVLTF
jgi:hypothetical protein